MALEIVQENVVGNAVTGAWSEDGQLVLVTRSGYRGPMRGHVLDAGLRVIASFPVPGESTSRAPLVGFADQGETVVTSDGSSVSRFDARTGALRSQHALAAADEHGVSFQLCSDGRVLSRWLGPPAEARARELRRVEPSTGAAERASAELARLAHTAFLLHLERTDDWIAIEDAKLARLDSEGAPRWSQALPAGVVRLLGVDARAVMVVLFNPGRLCIHDPETGALLGEWSGEDIRALGVLPDGGIWVVQGKGDITILDRAGAPLRTRSTGALTMNAAVSADGRRALLMIDRMELESSASVIDLAEGTALFETRRSFAPRAAFEGPDALWIAGHGGVVRIDREGTLALVHGKPATALAGARRAGAVVFASAMKLFLTTGEKPRVIGKTMGETMLALSSDGALALVHDEKGARVIDTRTGKATQSHDPEAVEAGVIDAVDEVLFDEDDAPCVLVGSHAYRLTPAGIVPRSAVSPPVSAVAVGLDEIITWVSPAGRALRIHLGSNGKAGIAEDGEALAWLGSATEAKKSRAVVVDGTTVKGKALDAFVRAGLVRAHASTAS